MNRNCTSSCESNEIKSDVPTTGTQASSLARPDRGPAALDHSQYRFLYSLLLEQGIDAFWLLKLHTGQFGWINLQPVYPILLGALTIVVTASGLAMLLKPQR